MILYVSGPMRGYPEFNFPAFREAAQRLRSMGHEPLSPAERDERNGFDPTGLTGFENLSRLGFSLRGALAADCRMICEEADGVVVLDGWQNSKGATAEVALARALGLPVLKIGHSYDERCVKVNRLVEVTP